MLDVVRVTQTQPDDALGLQMDAWADSGDWARMFRVMDAVRFTERKRWSLFLKFAVKFRPLNLTVEGAKALLHCFNHLMESGPAPQYGELAYSVWGYIQHNLGLVRGADGNLQMSLNACGGEVVGFEWSWISHVPPSWVTMSFLKRDDALQVTYSSRLWCGPGVGIDPLQRRLQNRCYTSTDAWRCLGLQNQTFPDWDTIIFFLGVSWVDGYLMRSLLSLSPNKHSTERLLAIAGSFISCSHTLHQVRAHAESRPPGSFIVLV